MDGELDISLSVDGQLVGTCVATDAAGIATDTANTQCRGIRLLRDKYFPTSIFVSQSHP
jgi:hypothetical protein